MSANRSPYFIALALTAAALLTLPSLGIQAFAQEGEAPAAEQKSKTKPATQKAASGKKAAGKKGKNASEGVAKEKEQEEEPTGPITALTNAKIYSLDMAVDNELGLIQSGIVLIQDGKILDVGTDLKIPSEAERFDCGGMVLTPGLIDASSALWLTNASRSTTASDASLHVLDGVDPYSDSWNEVIASGVTAVYHQPASSGSVGGTGAVLSVAPASEDSIGPEKLAEDVALQMSLGVNARNNRTRSQQLDRIKKLLGSAKDYEKKWDEYREYQKKLKDKKDGEKKEPSKESKTESNSGKTPPRGVRPGSDRPVARGRGPIPSRRPSGAPAEKSTEAKDGKTSEATSKDKDSDKKEKEEKPPEKPELDPIKEMLVKAIHGKLPVRLTIRNADDFHFASKLLEDFDELAVIYEGVSDLGSATEPFVRLGKPVILGPWSEIASNYQTQPDGAANYANGFSDYEGTLVITTASRDSLGSKHLRMHAAAAVAAGISPAMALKSITINAARALGVADSLGSIEKGKRADLVLIAGSPIDETAPIHRVWSGGKLVHESIGVSNADSDQSRIELADSSTNDQVWPTKDYVLKSKHVLKETGEFTPASLLISDGKIASVESIDFVSDHLVVDVGDRIVTPGLLSSSTTLGIASLIDPTRQADASYVVAANAIAGELPDQEELVAGGLLRAILTPGSRNPLSGTASLVALGRETTIETETLLLKLVLSSASRSTDRFPSSLPGQVQLIEQSLNGNLLPSRLYLPASVVEALDAKRKSTWQAIKAGEMTVLIEAAEDSEIRAALDLVEEFDLRAVIAGPKQLKPHIERLASTHTGVLLNPLTASSYDWYAKDLALASKSGVEIGFVGSDPNALRRTAGAAKRAGMSTSAAMLGLTAGPSAIGINNQIAAGAPADIVVWSGSPLTVSSVPVHVIVGGVDILSSSSQPGVVELAEARQ
ncbi:MAG: amidohydrolase family protein [Aureliella sp.]